MTKEEFFKARDKFANRLQDVTTKKEMDILTDELNDLYIDMPKGWTSDWRTGQIRRGTIQDIACNVTFRVDSKADIEYDWNITVISGDDKPGREYGFKEEWPSELILDTLED